MRLAHFITSLERGGAQAVVYDLVRALHKKGYQQVIIYIHDGPYRKKFLEDGVILYQICGFLVPFDFLGIYRLFTLLKQLKPDCLHTVLWAANWMGRLIAKFLGITCIASLHNNYDQNGNIRSFLDRLVPFSNNVIIAVSDEVKNSFLHRHSAACSIEVIRNGIDIELPTKNKITLVTRPMIGCSDEHIIIGSVGRFHPVKRYPLLLEAFAQVYRDNPFARLLLIGTGPEEKYLRSYARKLEIYNAIIWIIDSPAQDYYNVMDCFVLTSEKEGISMALLEAMNWSRACLVTYACADHPVLEHMRNGIVAMTSNATELAQALSELTHNADLREMLARQARYSVQNCFANSGMIAAYDRLFQQAGYVHKN